MKQVVLVFTILLMLLVPAAGATGTAVITVGKEGGADHEDIQAAVDAANEGDIIRVWNGSYQGNVLVNKSLTFIGNGSAQTSILGDGKGSVLTFATGGVELKGFTVSGGSAGDGVAGIRVEGDSSRLLENIISGNLGSGIYIQNASVVALANNTIKDNSVGLSVVGNSSDCFVILNLFNNNSEAAIDASDNQGDEIRAISNWWGHGSGPYHGSDNPSGEGDPVLGSVNFSAWLLAPPDAKLPVPNLESETDRPYQGQTVEFEASVSGGEGEVVSYLYDFGDGNTSNWVSKSTVEYRFTENGDFVARVKIRTAEGYESAWSDGFEVEVKEDKVPFEPVVGLLITLFIVVLVTASGLTILMRAESEEDPACLEAQAKRKKKEEEEENAGKKAGGGESEEKIAQPEHSEDSETKSPQTEKVPTEPSVPKEMDLKPGTDPVLDEPEPRVQTGP